MIYDGGEVGGSREFQPWQHHPVGFNDPLNTCNTWEKVEQCVSNNGSKEIHV